MYRIIGADQKEYGPVSAENLRGWIREGRLNAQTLAWTPGMNAWQPLGTLPDFAGAFPAAAYAPSAYAAPPPSTTNAMAVIGFIFSLLSIPCCWTIFLPLLGLLFSIIGVALTGEGSQKGGRNLAVVGIVISVLMLLAALMIFIVGAIGAATDGSSQNGIRL